MYKLLDDFSVDLAKVTPKALKSLKELSLYDIDLSDIEIYKIIIEIFVDESKLKQFLNILFGKSPDMVEEIDLTEVFRGYKDFFYSLTGSKPS